MRKLVILRDNSIGGKLRFPKNCNRIFAETLRRHETKPNSNDFGEEEILSWWREKDLGRAHYANI